MKTIKIADIILGDRQRKHIDKRSIEELATSIAEKGLFHAIVCVEIFSKEGEDYHGFRLIAGERRLRAIQTLSVKNVTYSHDGMPVTPGIIPYILIDSDLDAIQLREAELEENLIRVDLSWQDKTAALDELHELRLAQNPKHTVIDLAREIAAAHPDQHSSGARGVEAEIHKARLVAGYLDSPDVAHAKDLTQAVSIVSKKIEAEFNIILVERGRGREVKHTLIHGDFADVIDNAELPEDFSCIIADPPYGVGADKFGDAAQLTHVYKDDADIALALAETIFATGLGCTLPEAHLYLFCDIDLFLDLRKLGGTFGWTVWRTPLIWRKTSSAAHAPRRNLGFRRSYELILFASKGDKPFSQVYPDVIEAPAVRDKDVAAQKPVELYETLLRRSCLTGDKVLDPCCGSGTIFKAAESLRLEAWGVEKDRGAYEIAQLTLSSLGEEEPK